MNAADFRTGDGANLTGSNNTRGTTYFFTVPAESASPNCSGTAVSIEYCYRARHNDINVESVVFVLLTVARDGLNFTIQSPRNVIRTTPTNSTCTEFQGGIEQICCGTTPLSGFQIPSSEYTFGIVITNRDVRPLAFVDSVMGYCFDQFRTSDFGNDGPEVNTTVTFTEEDLITDRALLLIRVIIGMLLYYILLHNISVLINYRTYSTNNYQTSDHH